MTDCNICCEEYKGRNKEVECIHCQFSACTMCCKKYILSIINDAKCMNCGKTWDRDFLVQNFSYAFVDKTYKKHREEILYDRQQAMMEETQIIVEQRKRLEKFDTKIHELEAQIRVAKQEIRRQSQLKYDMQYSTCVIKTKEVVKFFGHCPMEDCRGFINSSWMCGICDTKICRSCKERNTVAHECNPETVESVKAIKSDCKPCPKCKCMIVRISGCRQMFCTICHTAFDWKSGEVVVGIIHNPHYIEWQRNSGGVMGVINDGCHNNQFNHMGYYSMDSMLKGHSRMNVEDVFSFTQIVRHVRHYEMPGFNRNINNDTDLGMRIDYILKKSTEVKFKQLLQQREKRIMKQRDIYLILDMFCNTADNYLYNLFYENNKKRSKVTEESMVETIDIIKKLVEYTNDSMKKTSNKYKNKTPRIHRNDVSNLLRTKIEYTIITRKG
jgi:hypothetical protein